MAGTTHDLYAKSVDSSFKLSRWILPLIAALTFDGIYFRASDGISRPRLSPMNQLLFLMNEKSNLRAAKAATRKGAAAKSIYSSTIASCRGVSLINVCLMVSSLLSPRTLKDCL